MTGSKLKEHVYQRWLAINLINGLQPSYLAEILKDVVNVSNDEIIKECEEILSSGLYSAARGAYEVLLRREWLLNTLDDMKKHDPEYLKIEKIPTPSFKEFVTKYFAHNKPVVFRNAINHWPAAKWTPQNLLEEVGGDIEIPVMSGRNKTHRYEEDMSVFKSTMKFGDYINGIVLGKEGNDTYLTANNFIFSIPKFAEILKRDIGNIGDGYLELSSIVNQTHMWVGPKGTVTALHYDMPSAFLVQIHGDKKIKMIPSIQVPYIYNNSGFTSDANFQEIDYAKFPLFSKVTPIEIILNQGDVLFLPVGWWHEVTSLAPSISLTINAINTKNNYYSDHPMGNWSLRL